MNDESGKMVINPDDIMSKHAVWAGAEAKQKGDAFTRNEAINGFCDETGIAKKALTQFRQVLKIKSDDTRRDVVRSWQNLMPVLVNEVFGNEPEMDLDPEDEAESTEQPEFT